MVWLENNPTVTLEISNNDLTNLRLVAGRAEDRADERLELPSHLPEQFQRQKRELDMWGKFAAAQAKIANNGHERSGHMVVS